jgi:uncharacterized protein YndB with AHSA1/START domain
MMSARLAVDDLIIRRSFDAPASLVFSLWSEPGHMRQWMGPHGFECCAVEIDFRVGGTYRAMIKSPEHDENWFGGVYREIERDKRLVFTFAWDNDGPSAGVEMLITITFEEHAGKTTQTFHQTRFLDAAARDRHMGGWNSSFDKQQAYVKQLAQEPN